MKRRRIAAPADMAAGIGAVFFGLVALLTWLIPGDGFWSIGLPAMILIVAGAWIIRREWRRKP